MKVTEVLTFQQYWNDSRFLDKRPIMNGSVIRMYGDNIYHQKPNANVWIQEDSHHSYEGGKLNKLNRDRDLSGQNVLISEEYVYLGRRAILLENDDRENIVKKGPGFKKDAINSDLAKSLIDRVFQKYGIGLKSLPNQLTSNFKRYNGK